MLTKIEQYAIDRVRDRRNQLGLTQDDLAIKSGYSSGFIATVEAGKKGKKYNLREAISIDEAREISEQKLRLPQRLAQPWCAERVVKQLRIDMEQHTKEWQNNPMLEGELILFLDATNHVSLDEIRLFYDEKKGLEWEGEKRG